jgi:hypothetical protein
MSQTTLQKEQQEKLMNAKPEKEHEWLEKFLGDWTFETEAQSAHPASKGTERVRSIGGIWVVAEGQGPMPDGTPATTIMTLGYDTQRKRYVGTWLGSMMTYLWPYEGQVDSTGRILTLDSVGPSMEGDGTTAPYQDVFEFKDDNTRVLTARTKGKDGTWKPVMTAVYRRKT